MHPVVRAAQRVMSGTTLLVVAFVMPLLVLAAGDVSAQDALTIGNGSARAGNVAQVPVYVRDVSTTALGSDQGAGKRIQALGFKVTYSPASPVTAITFSRAGALAGLTALYEATIPSSGAIGYAGSFSETAQPVPLTLDAAAPGTQIGTLSVTLSAAALAGTIVSLTMDPATATLSNQAGTIGETVGGSTLLLTAGSVIVEGATTITSLASSANPAFEGQSVTFTAAVTSGTPGAIGGTVTFKDGGAALGSATLSGGQASFAISSLSQGTHSITASYGGDTSYLPSTSGTVYQVVNVVPFGAPPGFSATAVTSTQVSTSWLATSGAAHYEVYRSSGTAPVAYTHLISTAATSYADTSAEAGKTYLYKVRAIDSSSNPSDFSAPDVATTVIFSDDPIVAGSTVVRSAHITQLQSAVNSVRVAAGLSSVSFTGTYSTGSHVYATHVQELRDALTPALSNLGLAAAALVDGTLGVRSTVIKARHLQDLRNAVK